jgi:hypothetical protein
MGRFRPDRRLVGVVHPRAGARTRGAAGGPPGATCTFPQFNVTRWSDGRAASAGVVKRWPLYANAGHSGSFGAGLGVNHHRSDAPGDEASQTRASVRVQAEAGGPAPAGRYYTLLQATSFRDGWFVTAQYDPAAWPLALEWSRYGERGYHASTTTLRVALGDGGWSLRVGSVRDDDGRRAVFGVGYNGF